MNPKLPACGNPGCGENANYLEDGYYFCTLACHEEIYKKLGLGSPARERVRRAGGLDYVSGLTQ